MYADRRFSSSRLDGGETCEEMAGKSLELASCICEIIHHLKRNPQRQARKRETMRVETVNNLLDSGDLAAL